MIDHKSEVVFWTGIMKDHAMFQVDTLSPSEVHYIQNSMQFMNFFQQILNRIESEDNIEAIEPMLLNGLRRFIEYKKMLLNGLLTCKIKMNLPPTLINHQINEALEFEELLAMPEKSKIDTPVELVKMLKIWLADSVGHAANLASVLDPVEALLAEKSLKFKEDFNKLLTKASELEIMLVRTCLNANALEHLAEETVKYMEMFICYLEEIKMLRMSCKILGFGTFSPLLPNHFIREHRYFIEKIKSIK